MITVVIPALNECKTIGTIVQHVRCHPQVSEVIVVDDGSIDGTPDIASLAGAKVITSTFLGKGASMQDGARAAANECLLFMDGDLSDYAPDLIHRMTSAVLSDRADFVKARFTRTGGRVTELSAKPLLQLFFPGVAADRATARRHRSHAPKSCMFAEVRERLWSGYWIAYRHVC